MNVQQAYVSYFAPVGSGLTFDVGKFVTPIGIEPTEANLNNNYSRAFLYALGPYYHVGARASVHGERARSRSARCSSTAGTPPVTTTAASRSA